MAKIAKKTKRYPSDLTDEEWEQIAPLMPKPGRRGRPREVDFREVINAVRYLVRSGCGWRMLPIHFGPWQTVYGWFRELARRFLFQTIHDVTLMLDRERAGREASPTAGVIDSQSVKAPAPGAQRGYDAGKKIVGRKRHIAVDTDGRLLMVNLTPADISDSAGAQAILDSIRKRWPWVKHLFADAAYDRLKLMDKAAYLDFVIEIIRRSEEQKGLPGSAPPLGRRAHLRLDDPMATPRVRLRAAHRRLSRHDARRHGWKPATKNRSSMIFQTDSKHRRPQKCQGAD
jgi:transposase